jgi:ferredoxin
MAVALSLDGLQRLFDLLSADGRRLIGPRLVGSAITYRPFTTVQELPQGWTDRQGPGDYRLARRDDAALFGYVVGPDTWKPYVYPRRETLWRARRSDGRVELIEEDPSTARLALVGVRACEIAALSVLDRVFNADNPDPRYALRRQSCLVIAVNCSDPAATCFCDSMGTGPEVTGGFDVLLTEVIDEGSHYFVAESGSAAGEELVERLAATPASPDQLEAKQAVSEICRARLTKRMVTADLPGLLVKNLEHKHWERVAERCLACGNCTLVCPTCFCSTTADTTDLATGEFGRERRWDSCFSLDFSYVVGHTVRGSVRSRYRQWLTHKLGTWHQQFGTSGCVGCGRCVTWCPVGIDLTEEVEAIRGGP